MVLLQMDELVVLEEEEKENNTSFSSTKYNNNIKIYNIISIFLLNKNTVYK